MAEQINRRENAGKTSDHRGGESGWEYGRGHSGVSRSLRNLTDHTHKIKSKK